MIVPPVIFPPVRAEKNPVVAERSVAKKFDEVALVSVEFVARKLVVVALVVVSPVIVASVERKLVIVPFVEKRLVLVAFVRVALSPRSVAM